MRNALLPLSATLLITGCGSTLGDDLADVLPDDRIAINMPVENAAAKTTGAEKQWSDLYLLTAEVTEDVNGLITVVLYTVSTIARELEPTTVDEDTQTATWGPWGGDGLDPTEGQLVVQKHDDGSYTWAIQMWPKGDQSQSVDIVAGEVDADATRDANTGRFDIDFASLNAMDPTEQAVGLFSVDYGIDADGAHATVSYSDFEGDRGGVDAYYFFDQTHEGAGHMDLEVFGDFEDAGSLEERLTIRSRWAPEGAGRSDAYATEGDLGEFVGERTECWDNTFDMVYRTDNYSQAPVIGEEASCSFDQADFPG